ncbi:MAG TPA: TolC family protein [Vicinamibacterales bacterium]|nr:TolC family protein [Vicinamibacterales bacterium]
MTVEAGERAAIRGRRSAIRGLTSVVLPILLAAPAVTFAQTPLTLEDAMRRARDDTAEARVLASSVDEAAEGVRRARAGFWPRIDVAEAAQRGDQPVFVFSSLLAQRRFTEANFAIPALNRPDAVTNTRTSVSIQQAIFDGGRTSSGVRAASLDRDLAGARRDAARQDLAFDAAQAFVHALEQEARVRAAQAAVDAAESDRERARARRDVGLATDADVLAVDVHLADMRQQRISASGDLAVAYIQLAGIVGLPLTTSLTLVRPTPWLASGDDDALVSEALTRHPRRHEADVQIQRADNARRAARAALLPTVGAQAGWELNGATLATQRSSWALGVDVRINLFDGFATRARMAEAAHTRAKAIAERERVDRRIEIDVRASLAEWTAARAREGAGRAALAQARESQRIVRERYAAGLATIADVLRAAEAVRAAESRATAAEMAVVLQRVALERALGRL